MKAGKLKTALIIILSACIVGLLCFIWVNSALPPAKSTEVSSGAYETVMDVVEAVAGTEARVEVSKVITPNVFRKITHAIEFMALGGCIILLYKVAFGFKYRQLYQISLIGILVAVIDESIQVLSGRGANVIDVWIDLTGYIIALGFMIGVFALVKYRRKVKALKTARQVKSVQTNSTDDKAE